MRNSHGNIKTPLSYARQCRECFSFLSLDVPPGTYICDNCLRRERERSEAANELNFNFFSTPVSNPFVQPEQRDVSNNDTPDFSGGGGDSGGGGANGDW